MKDTYYQVGIFGINEVEAVVKEFDTYDQAKKFADLLRVFGDVFIKEVF